MGFKQEGPGGQQQEVDVRGRGHVDAIIKKASQLISKFGAVWNFVTSNVTLTTANESAIFHLENNHSDLDLVIPEDGIEINFGISTGGGASGFYAIEKNNNAG